MRTRVEGVWAAGDCVESFHRVSRQPVVIALGTHANKQGRTAGINLGGGYAAFGGVLGTAITRVGDLEVARTGLNEREATAVGFEYVTATNTAPSRAHYYPGGSEVTVKLLAERGSGRLLGGQIVGGADAAKRIDVIATALWNEMTVAELGGVDLAYAPPFSPVWDPVLLAAGRAAAAVERAGLEQPPVASLRCPPVRSHRAPTRTVPSRRTSTARCCAPTRPCPSAPGGPCSGSRRRACGS